MNQLVLITGASSGIGLELSKIFARNNYDLFIIARSEDKLSELKKELESAHSVKVTTLSLDLSLSNSSEQIFDLISKNNMQVDALVNNAGFGDYARFWESDSKKLEEMINLNVLTLTKLTRLILPAMVERRNGYILNVASVAAFMPGPFMAVYYATKAYVLSFSEALSEELRNTGVSVTVLCPGATQTGFEKRANAFETGIFNSSNPTAFEVAEFAYDSLFNKEVVAIHKFSSSVFITLLRFMPRWVVRYLVGKMQG